MLQTGKNEIQKLIMSKTLSNKNDENKKYKKSN